MVHRAFDGTANPGMGLSLWHIVGLPGSAAGHALDINIVWDSFTPIGTRIDWYTYKGGVVGLNYQWRSDGSFFASGGIASGGPFTTNAPLTVQSLNDGNIAFQVENTSSQIPFLVFGNGNTQWVANASTALNTLVNSPSWRCISSYWNGAANVFERFQFANVRISGPGAGLYCLQVTDQSGYTGFALAGSGGQVGIGLSAPSVSSLGQGQLAVVVNLATTPGIIVKMAATPTAIGYGLQDHAGGLLWDITQTGSEEFRQKDSTTEGVLVGSIVGGFNSNTHASYTGRMLLNAADFAGTREVVRMEADGTSARIGFLGATAVVRPAATTDLLQDLIGFGLKTTGGPTPLNLLGGAFQASTISDLVRDSATSITTQMILLTHQSTATPTAGFGSHIEFALDDSANVNKRGGKVSCEWVTATDGATVSSVTLQAAKINSYVPCLVADGNQLVTVPGSFLHNGVPGTNTLGFFGNSVGTGVVQQANASQGNITAVVDVNAKAALQAIYNLLAAYGLAPATA